MKRLHIHIAVTDLEQSIGFYSTLFGSGPALQKPDYARWQLDDPQVNFAISTRSSRAGLDHLGIQVDDDTELAAITARLHDAGASTLQQDNISCCYARSNKTWVDDPQGIRWESFHSMGEHTHYGVSAAGSDEDAAPAGSCCAPPANTRTQVATTAPDNKRCC